LVIDGPAGVMEFTASSPAIGVIEGDALYGYAGGAGNASDILVDSQTFAALEPLIDDNAAGVLVNTGGNAFGNAAQAFAHVGPAALATLLAADQSTAAAPVAPTTVVSATVVLGPVIDGNGLSINLYDGAGNLLASNVPLDANGSFSITLNGVFPVVVAVLNDADDGADFRDEASGNPADVTATLMGIGNGQTDGTVTNVKLNINPVTTIAAQRAGVTADGDVPPRGSVPMRHRAH
jgi:hypothetical protein